MKHKQAFFYLLNCWCVSTNPSSLMGNFTSQLPTIFWILKSKNFAGKPSFWTTLAYFLAASLDCSSLKWEKDICITSSVKYYFKQAALNPKYITGEKSLCGGRREFTRKIFTSKINNYHWLIFMLILVIGSWTPLVLHSLSWHKTVNYKSIPFTFWNIWWPESL